MKSSPSMIARPRRTITSTVLINSCKLIGSVRGPLFVGNLGVRFRYRPTRATIRCDAATDGSHTPVNVIPSDHTIDNRHSPSKLDGIEAEIEKIIYRCRFLALLGVCGSLVGSVICFIKGCTYVVSSYMEYFMNRSKVIVSLVEAIDVYLLGTVMLVFGMGLYELFVSNLDIAKGLSEEEVHSRSNLFGLFSLKERPRWLEIKSVNELKTKLGHVIVMLLLINLFDKSKKAAINTPVDLLCFAASILLSSGCLYLLSKLNDSK